MIVPIALHGAVTGLTTGLTLAIIGSMKITKSYHWSAFALLEICLTLSVLMILNGLTNLGVIS